MAELQDEEILSLFNDNPNYAFNLLVKKYQKQIYWHVRRILIDHDDTNDVVQNTFIKIWNNIDNFRQESKLYTWIYRIATNESLTFLKHKKTFLFIPIINIEKELINKIDDDHFFKGDEIQKKLQKAILQLPEKQRIVFNMRYYDHLKYEDMAEILRTSTGALKASFHIAIKKIEKFLTEN